jgi:hypothetical protein
MPGLVPGIHVLASLKRNDVDGRDEPGHDEEMCRHPDPGRCDFDSAFGVGLIFGGGKEPSFGDRLLPGSPLRTKIRSRNDAPGRVSVIRPIGVALINRRWLAIIGVMVKVVDRLVAAAVRDPAGAADLEGTDLWRDIGPTLVGLGDIR